MSTKPGAQLVATNTVPSHLIPRSHHNRAVSIVTASLRRLAAPPLRRARSGRGSKPVGLHSSVAVSERQGSCYAELSGERYRRQVYSVPGASPVRAKHRCTESRG